MAKGLVNASRDGILAGVKQKVYIETSIISYLTSRRSRDMLIAAHQELTLQWWEQRAGVFALVVSELVREEASRGDPAASAERLAAIENLPILAINDEAVSLAGSLVESGPIPDSAVADALHIAVAAVNGADYLLTWNCKHLANAVHRSQIEA
ncbi:MAG: type II toxin-antitoxin system VapC family toxin, partial [Candidatus Hydrogenedentes bacterium]|nr:type II toxin-antitoxin system VapC family toxin [Candidatus Hydrogenedentota bacterium]